MCPANTAGLFGLVDSRLLELVTELLVRKVHDVVLGVVVHLVVNLLLLTAAVNIYCIEQRLRGDKDVIVYVSDTDFG